MKGDLLKKLGKEKEAEESFKKAEILKNKKMEKKWYYKLMKKL
ncbi:hypothetical protein [Methanobrevibacter arboriphilus]|nr:hypothetical protein [Methanobrevibacter arboriphilus]